MAAVVELAAFLAKLTGDAFFLGQRLAFLCPLAVGKNWCLRSLKREFLFVEWAVQQFV